MKTSAEPDSPFPTVDGQARSDDTRFSDAYLSGIIEIASDAIISVDESMRIVLYNRGAESIFGWTPQEAIGRPLDILLPERYRAAHLEHKTLFGQAPHEALLMGERREIAGLRRSGEEFPAEASISKLRTERGWLFNVVLRDATERRRIERAQRFLARAGEMLATSLDVDTTLHSVTRLAVEFLADCCVIFDAGETGGVRRLELAAADPAFAPLMDELRRVPLEPNERHPALAVLETGVAELIADVTPSYLREHAGSDGAMRLFREMNVRSAMLAPLVARENTMGVIAFYSTHPDRRYNSQDLALAEELAARAALALDNARLYHEARQAIQARDDVLAVVSHDLGNPLSAIRIGTSLLLRSVPPEERGKGGWAHLEGIRHSAEQMERLVNDLLEVKRIEAGHLALERARHTAEALIDETLELLQPIAQDRDVALVSAVQPAGTAIRCDRERMLQVFSNLVGNAIKFTPGGGRVRIDARGTAAEVVFSVVDTGKGIDREHLPHVFDRFWQAHRNNREGIGLGLAIVKGIVQAHGGRIWVESEPGVGTAFHFALPSEPADRA